jgi:hypothetical protein
MTMQTPAAHRSTSTPPSVPPQGTGPSRHLAMSQPRLPRWAGWLVAAVAAAAASLVSLTLGWNVFGGAVLAVLIFAVVLPTW